MDFRSPGDPFSMEAVASALAVNEPPPRRFITIPSHARRVDVVLHRVRGIFSNVSHRSRPSMAWLMRAARLIAVGLIVLLGLQSLGSRALVICLCEPQPHLALAMTDCCGGEQPCEGDVQGIDRSEPSDACNECVVLALGVDDAVVQAVPALAVLVMRPHWPDLLLPSPIALPARIAVLPRPPPLPDPVLRHLATVHLTI